MRYAIYLPNYGDETGARPLADLAAEAEAAGWDGFFLWDHMLASRTQRLNIVDPWVALAAMAMTTKTIRLGTTVTPVARRRPWKLARETVTLDHLSRGRLTLGVGLGEPPDADFAWFGEDGDRRVCAARLDEGLDILAGLWRGRAFHYAGRYYQLAKMVFKPPSLQQPRIPVWVGGFWPHPAPFRRAARWDGTIPLKTDWKMQPDDVRAIVAFVQVHRTSRGPFDVALIGSSRSAGPRGTRGAKKAALYAEAGVTWWLESCYRERNSFKDLRRRIRLGPPGG